MYAIGSGAKSASDVETCKSCHGTGYITEMKQTLFRTMQTQRVCMNCNGSGKIIKEKCSNCRGKKTERKLVKLTVKIPEGITDQSTLVVRSEGEAGINGGPRGDLLLEIHIKEDEIFSRAGDHVYAKIPISAIKATLRWHCRYTNGNR